MLVDSTKFKMFLLENKMTLTELADIEPKRSICYFSALANGLKDPSTTVRFEIMHKTNGYVMPWDWYNFDHIPAKFLKKPELFYTESKKESRKA